MIVQLVSRGELVKQPILRICAKSQDLSFAVLIKSALSFETFDLFYLQKGTIREAFLKKMELYEEKNLKTVTSLVMVLWNLSFFFTVFTILIYKKGKIYNMHLAYLHQSKNGRNSETKSRKTDPKVPKWLQRRGLQNPARRPENDPPNGHLPENQNHLELPQHIWYSSNWNLLLRCWLRRAGCVFLQDAYLLN